MPITDSPQLTTAQANVEERIRASAVRIVDVIKQEFEGSLELMFNHPTLTAQQVADALGTDGENFADFFGACRSAVTSNTPVSVKPVSDYGSITKDGDGTITVATNP